MEEQPKLNEEELLKQFKNVDELQTFLDGIFKRGVEHLLKGELDEHLGYKKHEVSGIGSGNSRNGYTQKTVKTKKGSILIDVPRDRNGSYEPKLIPKHKRTIDHIEDVVISFYAKGISTRDIEQQIEEIYGVKLSPTTISNITDRILVDVEQWHKRPLDEMYLVMWMDGIVFKVRSNGKIVKKTVFIVIGLNTQGCKEVLGLWIHENESASFWMNVLTELKERGVRDVLMCCTDNLKGLTSAIKALFPETVTQLCIVHQIRNSLRYIPSKHKQEFLRDLKKVYAAINLENAEEAFKELEQKWAAQYPFVIKSWLQNWEDLTVFYHFPFEIRKLIYTTNLIENLNRSVRKFTKNKTMFPDDDAVIKAVYLAVQAATKRWTLTVQSWPLIANQFMECYPTRAKINILTFKSS